MSWIPVVGWWGGMFDWGGGKYFYLDSFQSFSRRSGVGMRNL